MSDDKTLKLALIFSAIAAVGALFGYLTAPNMVSLAGGALALTGLVGAAVLLVRLRQAHARNDEDAGAPPA